MPVRLAATTVALLAATRVALLAATTVALAAGCTPTRSGDPDRVDLIASFYPLQFVAERVGGTRVRVTNLVRPGAEPHDLELTPRQATALATADLVVYLRGFQPALDEAVDSEARHSAFDVATVQPLVAAQPGTAEDGADHRPGPRTDPHVWLDPDRLATIGDRLADRLAQVDPGRSADFRSRAGSLRAELTALDRAYAAGLASCARRDLVTSHAAFGYLAARYRLTQIPITGLNPEEEPTPQRLAEIAALARTHGVTTIFFETLVSPKIAQTLAREVGARADVLDPIEGLRPGTGADYLSVMRDNLGRLRSALGCA